MGGGLLWYLFFIPILLKSICLMWRKVDRLSFTVAYIEELNVDINDRKYRLIQVGNIKKAKEIESDATWMEALEFEYMGAAEFEFGALPKALGRFYEDQESKVFGYIELDDQRPFVQYHHQMDKYDKESIRIRYLVRASQEEKLREALSNFKETRKRLKENAYFIEDRSNKDRFMFGIDKGTEFIAWTGKRMKPLIMERTARSQGVLLENEWMKTSQGNTVEQILKLK